MNKYDRYIDKILDYWFGKGKLNFDKWFKKGHIYDAEIKRKFSKILKEAEKGNLLEWLGTKKGYIAHIILMDQFSRHIYRGTIDAYKNDYKTVLIVESALDRYLDRLSAVEKMFVLMPYQHIEKLEYQIKGCEILANLVKNEKNPKEKNILKTALFHQKGHYVTLKRFGRFPKRNHILNRLSTKDEMDYINNSEDTPY